MTLGKRYQLTIHPASAVVAAAALVFIPSHEVLAVLCALALHEMGHMLALYLCGVRAWRFELTPFGGMADAKLFAKLHPLQQAICAISGVLVSLLGAWASAACCPRSPFARCFVQAQLSFAFTNILPVWPLDGARMLVALAACFGLEHGMRRLLAGCARVLGVAMIVLGLYAVWMGEGNLSLLLAGPYLCYAAREGTVAERVRMLCGARGEKLASGQILPVVTYVCQTGKETYATLGILGRLSNERYHVLMSIDHRGKLRSIQTEDELLDETLQLERVNGRIL